ncbi:unnamed protein product [Triticum aestivum]|nr:hypothetical protein CFC21_033128 [Triticum aestivum]SPT21205.1 unnamed protein product [Triticum aestivum]
MADMTLGSAQGAVDSLLGRLTTLLVDEVQLLGGVRRDVQFIKDEMESMNGFLLHVAEAAEEDHHQVGAWMKQVAEVAYASQNSVDRYIQSIGAGRREPGLLGYLRRLPKLVWTLPTRHRIANQIRELKIRSCEVGERRMRYDVKMPKLAAARVMKKAGWQGARNDDTEEEEDAEAKEPSIWEKETRRSWADDIYPHNYRMNGYYELESILNYQYGDCLQAVAVVAKGGKGKSVVGKAYRNALMVGSASPPSFKTLFDCKAWICLGQESTETAAFLRKILAALDSPSEIDLESAQLQPNEEVELITPLQPKEKEELTARLQPNDEEELTTRPKEKEEQELIAQLQLHLKGKTSLIVIDDVWDRSLWNRVKSAFSGIDFCKKVVIVINTPSIDVAQSFCPDLKIDLDTGSHFYVDKAMSLMKLYRLGHPELRSILEEIVSKPLPVRLFLRALYANPNRTAADLQSLCDNLDNSTTLSSYNARQVLKFCNLSSNCINCLLYMSIFPEIMISFKWRRLARIWAAEGMTARRGRLTALDEADHCFDQLIAHEFLIPGVKSDKGKVMYTRDDTFLDIFTQIAREDHFVKNNNHLYLA